MILDLSTCLAVRLVHDKFLTVDRSLTVEVGFRLREDQMAVVD